MTEHVEVAILGAGFAGLGMGIRLAREGGRSFAILERADDVGGTWRDNDYPGVACDVPSHLYSFSFRPKADWSSFFSPGREIQEYLRECAREEGLLPHLRFGAELLDARWDDGRWHLETATGALTADVLVCAAGRLSEPKIPDIDGLASFPGPVFHSGRWDHGASLEGARVGVVGTGASAIQIVPALAPLASRLVVFQRSAPYVVPRNDRAYSEAEIEELKANPGAAERLRDELFWEAEQAFPQRLGEPAAIGALRERATRHREEQVADPALRAVLTPDYEIGCKRVLISNDYYPALARESVSLEPSALREVRGSLAVSGGGAEYELDALVLATGFQSTRPPFAARVAGRDGRRLSEHWSEGMTAYASTSVHGFPNLFVIDGPNASLGHNSAVYMIEAQVDYILGALRFLGGAGGALEVRADAEEAYTREIDRMAAGTVWTQGGCTSWYRDERSGRLTLIWPDYAHRFRERNGSFDPAPYEPVGSPATVAS